MFTFSFFLLSLLLVHENVNDMSGVGKMYLYLYNVHHIKIQLYKFKSYVWMTFDI